MSPIRRCASSLPLPEVCDAVRGTAPAEAAKLTEERRQGVDLPTIRSQATEHRGLEGHGACGKRHVSLSRGGHAARRLWGGDPEV
jgi:hypothetical protein